MIFVIIHADIPAVCHCSKPPPPKKPPTITLPPLPLLLHGHMITLVLDADSVFSTVIEDQVDHVRAYFGMRKIKLGRVGGEKNLRPLLNDKFVFHVGMLDQVTIESEKKHRLG